MIVRSSTRIVFIISLTITLLFYSFSPAFPANNKALIIGISQYHELDCLSYADRDAIELADFFVNFGEYKADDITMVLNQKATKTTIKKVFQDLIKKSKKEPIDHLVIAYSGHGMPRHLQNKKTSVFLAPSDASISENIFYVSEFDTVENDTFITRGWLARQLATLNARKIVLLIDSCYSGIADFGTLFAKNLGCKIDIKKCYSSEKGIQVVASDETLKKMGKQVAFIAAGSEDQPSIEFDLLKHGAMSYCILKYLDAVRLTTEYDKWNEIPISNLFSAVYQIFSNFELEGQKLLDIHQPLLFPIPDYECIAKMKFQKIKGTKKDTDLTGVIQLDTDPPASLIFVDGKKIYMAARGLIELPIGKHRIALVLPGTNFRHVLTEDIKSGQLTYKNIILRGDLTITSFWEEKDNQGYKLTKGPELEVFLDGHFAGKTELQLSKIEAGTHNLEIKYKGVSKKRKIEIRPESPLRVRFVLNREKLGKAVGVGKRLPF